jgi:hypothetical protein
MTIFFLAFSIGQAKHTISISVTFRNFFLFSVDNVARNRWSRRSLFHVLTRDTISLFLISISYLLVNCVFLVVSRLLSFSHTRLAFMSSTEAWVSALSTDVVSSFHAGLSSLSWISTYNARASCWESSYATHFLTTRSWWTSTFCTISTEWISYLILRLHLNDRVVLNNC